VHTRARHTKHTSARTISSAKMTWLRAACAFSSQFTPSSWYGCSEPPDRYAGVAVKRTNGLDGPAPPLAAPPSARCLPRPAGLAAAAPAPRASMGPRSVKRCTSDAKSASDASASHVQSS
jgi:hypothetical protein